LTPPEASTPAKTLTRARVGELDTILAPSRGSGLIAVQILVRRGSADESPNEFGLGSFTAGMLRRGTATRSSSQIAFGLESIGAMMGHAAGADSCTFSIQSTTADFPNALEIFFDCLRDPAFDSQELEIERFSTLAALRRIEDEKFEYTYRNYVKQIFAAHGYGHPSEGEIENVEVITPDSCRAWHSKMYSPSNMLLVAAGDFDADEFVKVLERYGSGWNSTASSQARYDTPTGTPVLSSSLVLEKDLEQGFIVMGYRTPDVTHEDYPALRLACAALGEGFAGRLFTHLRDERSLAYAVGSTLRAHRLGGHMILYIGTKPESLPEAQEGLMAESEYLREHHLSPENLERARQYVAGKYLMDHQSLSSRAGYFARWEDSGAGAEYDHMYLNELRKVTADEILEAARRWWIHPTVVVLKPKGKGQG